jgi:hypothetical protein
MKMPAKMPTTVDVHVLASLDNSKHIGLFIFGVNLPKEALEDTAYAMGGVRCCRHLG